MTREELFDRYVQDTLDDEAVDELEKLLTGDPEFAARFAQDLIGTGKFRQVGSELQRIDPADKDENEGGDGNDGEENSDKPKRPRLLIGSVEDLPPSLQFLGPGESPPPPAPAAEAATPPSTIAMTPPQESVPEAFEEESESEEEAFDGGEEDEPPVAQPPIVTPPAVALPPQATSLQSTLPPPSPPPPPQQISPHAHIGPPAALYGHHDQPALRSAKQSSSTPFIVVAAILVVAIGVALFIGLRRKEPPPPESDSVIAKVDFVEGHVVYTRDLGETKLVQGTDLMEGDVINVRQGAVRIAYVGEKTYLHIRSGSEIRFEDDHQGKQVRLSLGEVSVEASAQPVGKPMVIHSSNARATLLGTKMTMRMRSKETLVEVSEGLVHVERSRDGASVEVRGGACTRVGEEEAPQAWEFVKGVNLNGDEVDIDGHTWMSFAGAKSAGLAVEAIGKSAEARISTQQPLGYVPSPGMRALLMSSVAAPGAKLAIKWPQPNGRYQLFVWMMEDGGNFVRALRLTIEDKQVAEDLGKEQTLGAWNRFGPYPTEVKDGVLNLLMSADSKFQNQDPHLAGIAIYRLAGTGPPTPPVPVPGAPPVPVDPGTPPGVVPTVPN